MSTTAENQSLKQAIKIATDTTQQMKERVVELEAERDAIKAEFDEGYSLNVEMKRLFDEAMDRAEKAEADLQHIEEKHGPNGLWKQINSLTVQLAEVKKALSHYQSVDRSGLSVFIKENGRFGKCGPWAELVEAIEATTANAELGELRRDKQRLDWIEFSGAKLHTLPAEADCILPWCCDPPAEFFGKGNSARAAIDNAMSTEESMDESNCCDSCGCELIGEVRDGLCPDCDADDQPHL